jgi:hypothetical protein
MQSHANRAAPVAVKAIVFLITDVSASMLFYNRALTPSRNSAAVILFFFSSLRAFTK